MKRQLLKAATALSVLLSASTVRADLFGGDVAVLAQILAENIKQLMELQSILSNGEENLELMREINRGINDSLGLMQTVSPNANPGMFGDLRNVEAVLKKIGAVYGATVESPDAPAQKSVDTAVAEAVAMNSSIYDFTREIDRIGEEIKSFSHEVSPGGAAKLTAQSMGVMLHVMNQQLRAQGTLLKLESQGLAQSNKREKDQTAEYLRSAKAISEAMKASDVKFERPRF